MLRENVTHLTIRLLATEQEIVFQSINWYHISSTVQLYRGEKSEPEIHYCHFSIRAQFISLTDQTHLNLYGSWEKKSSEDYQ